MKVYQRLKNDAGKWRYQAVKEGRGMKTGELKPPFYAHPTLADGRQIWFELPAQTFAEAKVEIENVEAIMEAKARGLTVAELYDKLDSDRVPLLAAVRCSMDDNAKKAPKTVAQYDHALKQFIESTKVKYIDEVSVDVLEHFKVYLERKGYAGKTCDTRINVVYFMLKDNGNTARIPTKYMPIIEEESPKPYSDEELDALFAAMNDEEKVRYRFFLGSGCRDREASFAAWSDIDFTHKSYHVCKKEDVGFFPKTHESREIQLPVSLLKELKARREKHPNDRFLFLSKHGLPDNHFLRKLKKIAYRAGLNCGHCKTTENGKEVSCADGPYCEHYILHRSAKRARRDGLPLE